MIVVLGGAGLLGQELTRAAARRGVVLKAMPKAVLDITDPRSVNAALDQLKPTVVVNAAAYTKVDAAESDPHNAARHNAYGPRVIASACRAAGTPLIHVSTDYVFDGAKAGPYVETDPVCPLSVYGKTKASGEVAVRDEAPHHIILRTAWLFSAFGCNFLTTIVKLAQTRDDLRIVADRQGCPTSAQDVADAILRIVPRLNEAEAPWGTYHFAGSGNTSWHGFASHIVAVQAPLTKRMPSVTAISSSEFPTAAVRPLHSLLDSSRFAAAFGFRGRGWQEAAAETTRSFVSRLLAGEDHAA